MEYAVGTCFRMTYGQGRYTEFARITGYDGDLYAMELTYGETDTQTETTFSAEQMAHYVSPRGHNAEIIATPEPTTCAQCGGTGQVPFGLRWGLVDKWAPCSACNDAALVNVPVSHSDQAIDAHNAGDCGSGCRFDGYQSCTCPPPADDMTLEQVAADHAEWEANPEIMAEMLADLEPEHDPFCEGYDYYESDAAEAERIERWAEADELRHPYDTAESMNPDRHAPATVVTPAGVQYLLPGETPPPAKRGTGEYYAILTGKGSAYTIIAPDGTVHDTPGWWDYTNTKLEVDRLNAEDRVARASGTHGAQESADYSKGYADAVSDYGRVSEESIRAMLSALEASSLDSTTPHMHDSDRNWRRGRRDAYRAYVAQEDAQGPTCTYCSAPSVTVSPEDGEAFCAAHLAREEADAAVYDRQQEEPQRTCAVCYADLRVSEETDGVCRSCMNRYPIEQDEDDVDILARISDHVPGESTHAAELDQHYRDGQLWASYEPAKARALLEEENAKPCGFCGGCGWDTDRKSLGYTTDIPCYFCEGSGVNIPNECRRAWLDGIAYGLEHGTKGLRPRMELEEEASLDHDMASQSEAVGGCKHSPSTAETAPDWSLPEDLAKALCGIENQGNFGQMPEADLASAAV